MKYCYYCSCVNWDSKDVNANGGLSDMIDNSVCITRSTFLKHINRDELYDLEREMGYERFARRGLTMANDYAVSYHKSKLHGNTAYYFSHSRIEYVFVGSGNYE